MRPEKVVKFRIRSEKGRGHGENRLEAQAEIKQVATDLSQAKDASKETEKAEELAKQKVVDIPPNQSNLTAVEAEFDQAMEKPPVQKYLYPMPEEKFYPEINKFHYQLDPKVSIQKIIPKSAIGFM